MPFAVYFKELPLPRVVHRAPTELNPTPACALLSALHGSIGIMC